MSDQTLTLNNITSGGRSQGAEEPSNFMDHGAPLPQHYGETRTVLLPRDPHWMYIYWEITEKTYVDLKSKHGENIFITAQSVVRMVEVNPSLQPLRSLDVPVSLDAKNWYLHADKEGGSWYAELGLKTPDGRFILIAKSNLITLPNARVSDIIDEKWVTIKEELEKVLEASGGGKVGMGSLELARMLAQRWETLAQISSWRGISSISSMNMTMGEEKRKERSFWLVADCELVLYGATEKTATVTVAEKPIELYPDGTFSLRLALPDGNLEIPIEAVSGDQKDTRTIHISVTRKTENK
ncbi:MAG: hypothetical protein A3I11_03440 [Elusimicrobia bacterium RIFCSPLOWO2_02_FULL_39_32]|nr:MAG: hypothetical protein A3B80_02010 [Elusimicrobia bacterium RIFCSPHIGHO2_02_FULL_39_36]OGR92761.1 MAG: hypothetical protein A3I11_03440 [Elusimicrobia bacterium RIFCSPLOWO2_02_FULL_39_32]OGR99546.1 MAG: hypothetical protein A3G85_00795 [Elusimicrobia bacterium RIFCSPLOWO2_12_FULL_39_28]